MRRSATRIAPFVSAAFMLIGCNENGVFLELADHLAAPISVAVDPDRNRAYVVNSNVNAEFDGASLTILDLTNPDAPVLLDSTINPIAIPDLSGEIFFDAATGLAFVSNRFSDNPRDTEDTLLRINLDEASPSFGAVESFNGGENPFGIACCDTSGRLYTVSAGGTVEAYDPANPSTFTQISLAITLASGELVSGRNSTSIALLGNQAFVTSRAGRIYVLNTSEVGDLTKNPIDYVILSGTSDLRGIATDGIRLYVVDATAGAEALRMLDPVTLTPIDPDLSAISEVAIETLQVASVGLGEDPNQVVTFLGRVTVSNRGSDSVSVIDTTSNTLITTLAVGDEPFGLAAFTTAAGTNRLYVTNLASNSISIVDLDNLISISTFAP